MRLGLNWVDVGDAAALDDRLDLVDDLGLGTVAAPADLGERTLADCRAHGEAVRDRGLTVVSLVGSFGAWAGSPHPDNYGTAARERARANCERVLDGLDLEHTTYSLEPWFSSFFHTPRRVRAFLDSVDDDRLGVHMDAMNMHTVETAYRSGELIGEAFDLLGGDVVSVHAKDLALDPEAGIYRLDDDLPVFTEHWDDADDYVETMRRLADTAARNGIAPVRG